MNEEVSALMKHLSEVRESFEAELDNQLERLRELGKATSSAENQQFPQEGVATLEELNQALEKAFEDIKARGGTLDGLISAPEKTATLTLNNVVESRGKLIVGKDEGLEPDVAYLVSAEQPMMPTQISVSQESVLVERLSTMKKGKVFSWSAALFLGCTAFTNHLPQFTLGLLALAGGMSVVAAVQYYWMVKKSEVESPSDDDSDLTW